MLQASLSNRIDGETWQRFFIPGESNRMDLSASGLAITGRGRKTPQVFAVLQGAYESYSAVGAGFTCAG